MQVRVMHTIHLHEDRWRGHGAYTTGLPRPLHLGAGASVAVAIDNGRLVITPRPAQRYTLDLLASTNPAALTGGKDDLFMTSGPVGRELL